jgi:competence ComEA-like helix-hairpin-helix protein
MNLARSGRVIKVAAGNDLLSFCPAWTSIVRAMTKDESRAVSFLGVLLLLSIGARVANRPAPVSITASPIDVVALRAAGQALAAQQAPKARSRVHKPPPRTAPTFVEEPGPLDLNRASEEQIEALPGIGPAVAARIVARRDSIGRYRKVEDLDSVKGIGPALIEKIRPLVVVR